MNLSLFYVVRPIDFAPIMSIQTWEHNQSTNNNLHKFYSTNVNNLYSHWQTETLQKLYLLPLRISCSTLKP